VATKGGITMEEIAYELPYAQGLQIIWDMRAVNGDPVRSASSFDTNSKKARFNLLMG